MSWNLIKSVQAATEMRMILPFGLGVRLGDVISVGKDGGFTLEGSARSLLGVSPGEPRPAQARVGLFQQSGKETTCAFRAAGSASGLFPDLPSAQAGFDISFATADSWLLALTGRVIHTLDEVNKFRLPILRAYERKVWKPDWALVFSVARVDKMTLIASSSADTKVALSLNAEVAAGQAMEAQLTADAVIAATTRELVKCIVDEPSTAFCSALRVRDPWWRSPGVGTLEHRAGDGGEDAVRRAEDDAFWEDVDDL